VDRRARKLEKKRVERESAKREARVLADQAPSEEELLVRRVAREPFGRCWLSAGWDAPHSPTPVIVVVTRELVDGFVVPAVAIVDRTCLGVKDGFMSRPLHPAELDTFLTQLGGGADGMLPCELQVAQSIVFHAIDYARTLAFEPHPNFPAALFGPRPTELLNTPWSRPAVPIYVPGPHDDREAIITHLRAVAGTGNFEIDLS
jgi:hypothetical protein